MLKKLIQYLLVLFYPLFKKVLPYQLYAYLAVGAANTALNIILFAIFYQFVLPQTSIVIYRFHMASYTVSLIIAFTATVPTGFWLAKHFAFNQKNNVDGQTAKQLCKYFLVVLQGLGSDYLLLVTLILFVGLHPTIAKVASTAIVLTFNFLLQKYFTFKLKEIKTAL